MEIKLMFRLDKTIVSLRRNYLKLIYTEIGGCDILI